MPDKHDNPSDEQARTTPQYRVRKPKDETSTSKSAQNGAVSRAAAPPAADSKSSDTDPASAKPTEIGGPKGLEPTRFGDWERDGRCVDF